jgi:hypothetical protein
MKSKTFQKKLVLNKKTVTNLNNGEMGDAKGGHLTLNYTCRPCDTIQTCDQICCPTFLCDTDPFTDRCWTVQFCTQ